MIMGGRFVFRSNETSESKQKRGDIKDSAVTILTNGCHFKGKLYCRGSTRIGGKVEGEIISEGLLIIEEEAKILADINADEVILQGRLEGRLEAKGRVELCSSCSFKGDVITPVLVIKEGAHFNGSANMKAQDEKKSVKEPKADISESSIKEKSKVSSVSGSGGKASKANITPISQPDVKVNL